MLDPKERVNVTVGSLVRINVSKKSDSSNLIIDYVEEVLDDYEFNQNGTKVKGRDTGKVGNTVEIIDHVPSTINYDKEKIKEQEGQKLEFKSTFSFDEDRFKQTGDKVSDEELKFRIPKAISAFANSLGGQIYIGIEDRTGKVLGLENDYNVLNTDADGFENQICGCLEKYFPQDKAICSKPRMKMIEIDGQDVFRINVKPSDTPFIPFKDGNFKIKQKAVKIPLFYVRVGNSSKDFTAPNFIKHWIDQKVLQK